MSPTVAGSLEHLEVLAVLSDRFQVAVVTSCCAANVSKLFSRMEAPAEALQVLSLPLVLRSVPEFQEVLVAAQDEIRKAYGPAMLPNAASDILEALCGLPQVGLEALLESSSLEVPSEDCVLQAALAWVRANARNGKDRLAVLTESVLPRLRLPFLSPQAVVVLVGEIQSLLGSVEAGCSLEPALSADAAYMRDWVARNLAGSTVALPQATMSFVATSQLAHCLERMRNGGVHVPDNVLHWCRPGTVLLQPRLSYQPPDATLKVCIPNADLYNWKREGRNGPAQSTSARACGRWVVKRL